MPAPSRSVSPAAARSFALRATGLVEPCASVGAALRRLGYVQIDPINVCGRMHDHILRPRVRGYNEGDLIRFLHGALEPKPPSDRTAFEHHLPSSGILVAMEREAWPYLLAAMRARTRTASAWSGRLTPREKELAVRILEHVGERGPLGSDQIADGRTARRVWGAATLVKATMQKLFFHGRLLIAGRDNGRRLYDLPARVLPDHILALPAPDLATCARWEIRLKLRQRRLVALKRAEVPMVEDLVEQITVEGLPPLFCLREDLPLLEACQSAAHGRPQPCLLAPLDPVIYDRSLTRRLWDFDYTWEVYTPPSKRRRGYYALPLLSRLDLVGDVDLRAERDVGRLVVISRRVRRGHVSRGAVQEVAAFLGLRT